MTIGYDATHDSLTLTTLFIGYSNSYQDNTHYSWYFRNPYRNMCYALCAYAIYSKHDKILNNIIPYYYNIYYYSLFIGSS